MIKAIIGLGNPGPPYANNRHNIGFHVVDAFAQKYDAPSWHEKNYALITTIVYKGHSIILMKPQTYMNNSGDVIPYLSKQGIKPGDVCVVHDELELPYGVVKWKVGGSARGHNGLRSIIQAFGPDFARVRCGIGRPEHREDVGNYVLSNFTEDPSNLILEACALLEKHLLIG